MIFNPLRKQLVHLRSTTQTFQRIMQISTQSKLHSMPSPNISTSNTTPKPLYAHQTQLPHLPVPELSSTLQKYLRSLEPLLSEEQLSQTQSNIESFLHQEGPKLQLRLKQYAEGKENWLEEWWNDLAYFEYRDPVVVYVSYFFVYSELAKDLGKNNTKKAAEIVKAALMFRKMIEEESLLPEKDRSGPLCMYTYQFMFNATRIPGKLKDNVVTYPLNTNFIIVSRKNKLFKVNTHFDDGLPLSTDEIEQQLNKVIELAGEQVDEYGIGILTAEQRDIWFEAREQLYKLSEKNQKQFELIEKASFLLALDSDKPNDKDELSRACWHGSGKDRYFDKSLQFIVFENGRAGFNGEHSRMDGTPTCRLNDFINDCIQKNKIEHGISSQRKLPEPIELKFDLNNELKEQIEKSKIKFQQLINKHELRVAVINYGKDQIKQFKFSPDAYAQMIIQLAFYLTHGKTCPTYESATTRKFQRGRTETVRTCSKESKAFVESMVPNSLSSITPQQQYELFQQAIKAHITYMSEAVQAKGVDRHLLGLKQVLKPSEPLPKLFEDSAFSFSKHWNLSTSQLSSEYFDGYGWGMVVDDGYGIAYMVKKNNLQFNVTCIKKDLNKEGYVLPDVEKMKKNLERAANLIKSLCEVNGKAKL